METNRDDSRAFTYLLDYLVPRLRAHQLKLLSKVVSQERRRRYPRKRETKYGRTVRRIFTPEEYDRFLKHCTNPKAQVCFQLMHGLGLRIGEVVGIKLSDVDFLSKTIIIHTEKSRTEDMMPLHDGIYELLRTWVNDRYSAIQQHDGYLFYGENPSYPRPYISKDWLRNYFGQVREEAGLNQTYSMTNEPLGRTPRRQFRLTSHSCRRTFGTNLYRMTKDQKIVQYDLRQKDIKSSDPYIFVSPQEVHDVIMALHRQSAQLAQLAIAVDEHEPKEHGRGQEDERHGGEDDLEPVIAHLRGGN